MIKVLITNNVNGKKFSATWNTQAEADQWIASCKANNSWGLPQRWIKGEEVPAEALQQRQVMYAEAVTELQEKLDAEGNPIMETTLVDGVETQVKVMEEVVVEEAKYYTEYEMPCEYEITITDLSQDAAFLEQQVIQKRAEEYKKIDNLLMEAIVEKELGDDTKWNQYLTLRAEIKTNNPK